jgi:hypothetical protein
MTECPSCRVVSEALPRFCSYCGYQFASDPKANVVVRRKFTQTQKWTLAAFALGMLLWVVLSTEGGAGTTTGFPESAASSSGSLGRRSSPPVEVRKALEQPESRVTMAAYEEIQKGMSYERVREIIGEPGVEMSRSDVAGNNTIMYSWKNANGSNMNAMFQNGGLVMKAQFGLP